MGKKSNSRKKQRRRQPPARRFPWHWLAWGGAAVLLIFAGLLVLEPWSSDEPQATPAVVGTPRLKVDRTEIDEGYVQYNAPVRTAFQLSNVGDQPLKILGEPQVKLVAGC